MATSNRAAWIVMQSKLMAMGYGSVVIGEPRSGDADGMIALIPAGGHYDESTLDAPREIHRVKIRMYRNWLQEPQDEVEFELDKFRAGILEDIAGDFDIGGEVAYYMPCETEWETDEAEVGEMLYRVMDITVAYRIDERATFVE